MEHLMNRLVLAATLALAASATLPVPAMAQYLSMSLPDLTFPDPAPVPSTKGCMPSQTASCLPQQ
jgi:hypothetical protein